jgi:hypothetical protein
MEENSFMASRERDDAMAGLLKRSLAGDAGGGNDCPGPDILAAYFERSLDADETARIELHLSECVHCREQLAALDRAEGAAAVPAAHAPRRAPRASWIWDWRWLAPVAAVLVLAAVWATRRPALTRIAEQPTQAPAAVATSQPAQQAKQQVPSRLTAPAPNAVPAANSGAASSKTRVNPASTENSPIENLVAPKSIEGLPLSGRNFTELKKLPQTTPAANNDSTDQAANSPSPAGASESVTVESAAPTVSGPAIPPSAARAPTAPAPQPNIGGFSAGVGSGPVSAKTQSSNAKEAPALMSGYRARSEIVTATQAGELSAAHIIPTPDSKTLWRIAGGGFIERSEDGGATWNGTLPKQNAYYVAGSAPSAKVCWLVGDDGIILLTPDASNWQAIPPPVRADFVAVNARNASSATVTTADGRKFTTTNRGKTWKPAE